MGPRVALTHGSDITRLDEHAQHVLRHAGPAWREADRHPAALRADRRSRGEVPTITNQREDVQDVIAGKSLPADTCW